MSAEDRVSMGEAYSDGYVEDKDPDEDECSLSPPVCSAPGLAARLLGTYFAALLPWRTGMVKSPTKNRLLSLVRKPACSIRDDAQAGQSGQAGHHEFPASDILTISALSRQHTHGNDEPRSDCAEAREAPKPHVEGEGVRGVQAG